jgi:RNA polymerase subunit RPABC4/transcription elongation factor Spt4
LERLERFKLRRRLDRQERMREALLLDLGAIIFELHRQQRREPELLQEKAAELAEVDDELRAIAEALEEGHGLPRLTARGLVTTCTSCNSLMGTRDRFCPSCGAAAGTLLPAGSGTAVLGDEEPSENGDEPADSTPPEHIEVPSAGHNGDQADESTGGPEMGDVMARAQRTMRAGRRAARSWIAQRRSSGR